MARFLLTLALLLPLAGAADACPMCKAANEAPQSESRADANLRPRAFMYSIFFMMGMPVVSAGLIGLALNREVRIARERSRDTRPDEPAV